MPSTVNPRLSNPQHSKKEIRWGTPSDIIERARRVMGEISLDPCSSVQFNETVKANKFYSLDDRGENGLELPWFGSVLCNPPGGLVRAFWRKLHSEPVKQFVWIGFSLEQLALLADEKYYPLDFSWCIPRKRVKFIRHDGYNGSPTHSNYIVANVDNIDKFVEEFSPLGRVQGLNTWRV